jgi:translocation and assembly module TamB
VQLTDFPHPLDNLRALALIYPGQIVLDHLDATLAGGTVRAAGSIGLGGAPASAYQLRAQVRDVSLRYPEGWAIEGDTLLVLEPLADGSGSLLSGRATLSRAAYLRPLQANLFELLQSYLRRQPLVVESVDTALTRTQLAVEVEAPGTLRVNNNVADLRGTAELRVRGNLARPVLQGRVEVEPGGKIDFRDTEYRLERGLLTFSRLDRIDPDVDLVARTQVSEYEVTLKLSGTLDDLKTSFSSVPPLPNLDVLALLTTGDLPSSGTLADTGGTDPLGRSSIEGLLLDTLSGAVTGRVKRLLRFDKLRIDPTGATSGAVNAARLLVGKQVSRDLYVTYQQSLSSSDQNLVQAEWRVAPGLVVVFSSVAERDLDRQFAVDLRWEKRF